MITEGSGILQIGGEYIVGSSKEGKGVSEGKRAGFSIKGRARS
jgi:hypothetical protein